MANRLGGRELRDAAGLPELDPDEPSNDLASAFRKIMERAANRPALTVANEATTVAMMFDYLRQRLEIEDMPISFEDALGGSTSPRIIAAAFLAVLEMAPSLSKRTRSRSRVPTKGPMPTGVLEF
jgi:hypothetical protein